MLTFTTIQHRYKRCKQIHEYMNIFTNVISLSLINSYLLLLFSPCIPSHPIPFPVLHINTRNVSGLPFFDVMVLEGLPKSASLPVATVQQTKARLADGRYDFDYIYFTESDQVKSCKSMYMLL